MHERSRKHGGVERNAKTRSTPETSPVLRRLVALEMLIPAGMTGSQGPRRKGNARPRSVKPP